MGSRPMVASAAIRRHPRLARLLPGLQFLEAAAGAGDGELVDVEAGHLLTIVVRAGAGFVLEAEDEVTVSIGEVDAQIVVAGLAHREVEGVPAPEVTLPLIAGGVAELDTPVEAGAERVRIDVVVEEAGAVQLQPRRLQLRRDLAAQ